MRIQNYNNNTPNFGTQCSYNIDKIFNALAKTHPKVTQGHLDVLKAIKNDGLKDVTLKLVVSKDMGARLVLDSELINDAMELITDIQQDTYDVFEMVDKRRHDSGMLAIDAGQELNNKLLGVMNDEGDLAIMGTDISKESANPTFFEQMTGFCNLPVATDKFLQCFKPGKQNLSTEIVKYHTELQKAYDKALKAYENFVDIVNAD